MSTQFLLDAVELGEPANTLVAGMGRSARRMNQMVLDLIEFTRLRFGDTLPLERAEMDVRTMLEEVVAEVSASHGATNVQAATSGDMRGVWDPARLAQALTNLVGNAVQHGSKTAAVRITAVGDADEVTIKVQNHGPVIPADKVAGIFQAMTMGTGGAGRDSRHMGLGLYIVERIVAAHGGTVGVESTVEKGPRSLSACREPPRRRDARMPPPGGGGAGRDADLPPVVTTVHRTHAHAIARPLQARRPRTDDDSIHDPRPPGVCAAAGARRMPDRHRCRRA
jgi:signal transduction histidine kinase